jgi:hypothetical protein
MMKKGISLIPQLVPTRFPQLFYGSAAAPRVQTKRQRLAERLFLALQVLSLSLFLVGAVLGYYFYQFSGLILFGALGYLAGVWMRRSLGIRGQKATTGFFQRMRERAQGAKPGLLEWLLEKVGQDHLTQARCREIVQVYDKAVSQLKREKSTQAQNKILADLDRKVYELLRSG